MRENCPKCGSGDIEETTMGLRNGLNPNIQTCLRCNHQRYLKEWSSTQYKDWIRDENFKEFCDKLWQSEDGGSLDLTDPEVLGELRIKFLKEYEITESKTDKKYIPERHCGNCRRSSYCPIYHLTLRKILADDSNAKTAYYGYCTNWFEKDLPTTIWTSTEEREPEYYKPVLIFVKDKTINILNAWRACGDDGSVFYTITGADDTIDGGLVTHWMSLPEAPEIKSQTDK